MRKITFILIVCLYGSITQGNTLLQNVQTGQPFTTGTINEIELVSNGTDVALIIANNTTRSLYAIDINDNNPGDSAANAITQIQNFKAEIEAHLGFSVTIQNFEVNPISKSVYVLVYNGSNIRYIVVVRNNGVNLNTIDLTNVNYVAITYTTSNFFVQDMTWGNNTLYVSSGNFALAGHVGVLTAPFVHNSATTNRTTSMFKSNWGGGYWTNAPLEKFDFATINGENRLMGVTVCAPGFSFEVSALTGSGALQVEEQFNINSSAPIKVVTAEQNDTSYLFDLHPASGGNVLIRVGEKYIDGSRISDNQYNANRKQLRDGSGNPSAGLTDADIKIYSDNFHMIAYYTDYQFLVLDNDGTLRLFQTSTPQAPSGIKSVAHSKNIAVYPNPATKEIFIRHFDNLPDNSQLIIYSLEGKEMYKDFLIGKSQIRVSSWPKGVYLISVTTGKEKIFQDKLVIN